jgi:hypothetical protein
MSEWTREMREQTWWQRKAVNVEALLLWGLGVLLVGLFVLWATAGRAAELEVRKQIVVCDPDYTCTTISAQQEVRLDCLDKMEAAMRAMEPFSAGSYRHIWIDTKSDASIRIELPYRFEPRMLEAMKMWSITKNECWRKS